MSKSIRLKNNTYIDSTCIINKTNYGEKNNLNDILGNWGNTLAIDDFTGDINNISRTGWIMVDSSCSNLPPKIDGDGCYYLLTFVKNPNYYIKQIAFSRNGLAIFQRNKIGQNNWGTWSRII